MKKNLLVLLIICLIFTSTGCGTRNEKISDIPELPLIEGMELEKTKNSATIGYPHGKSTYIMENEDINSFFEKYENALTEEDWIIVERREASTIDVEKLGYSATIVAYISENKLKVDIIRNNNIK